MNVAIGQVWKDLDRRANNRTIEVMAVIDDGDRVEGLVRDGFGNAGKTIRVRADRLNAKGHWRLLKQADGTVPETGLDDAFADVNDREGDALNQLVLFGTPEFIVDSVGLSKHGAITVTGGERVRNVLLKIYSGLNYWIGDHVRAIEGAFGEEASQVIDHQAYESAGISESTLKNMKWVAERVPDENRRIAPSWSHAQAVAALRPDQQRKFLEQARAEDWSVPKLKTQIAMSTEEGKSRLVYLLIVDCATEAKLEKLAGDLEREGWKIVKKDVKTKRAAKPKKEKKVKAVTAKKKGKGKMSANRRRPG
jgi:hypothetical protein